MKIAGAIISTTAPPLCSSKGGTAHGEQERNFKLVILVESRSWRDRNLKFGPNCDLEVDNLEKNKKIGEAKPSQIFYFFPNFKFRSRQLLLSV